MSRALLIPLVIGAMLCGSCRVQAQTLFEESRNAFQNPDIAISEHGGSLRGGVNFSPFLPPRRSELIFRGSSSSNGICGFDVFASFIEEFEKIPEMLEELAPAILAGVGVTLLCQSFPSACDIIKHLHQWINVALRARFAQCQEMILASMNAGVALRADAQGLCMRQQQAAGATLEVAWETCVDGSSLIPGPNDLQAGEINVISDALRTTGVIPEDIARVIAITGDFTLSTDGSAFSRTGFKPNETLLQRYIERKQTLTESITRAVSDVAAGAPPNPMLLRDLSIPGQPMPSDVLQAIALEPDSTIRDFETQKLAGSIALANVVSDIWEVRKILANTANVSSLQPSQRAAMETTLKNLESERDRIVDEKEMQERHVIPAMQALLEKSAARMAEAEHIARNASSGERIPSRFPETGQSSFGYTYRVQ